MPSPAVLRVILRELTTRERTPRVPEPDLVMDDQEKVSAYTRAGREDGVMAPVYLFHCAQVCDILRDGDLALDLGCGPANQLAQIARITPGVQFIGIDLSEGMLDRARTLINEMGLSNVELRLGSMTDLSSFADGSVDAAFSTMAFHHLLDQAHLNRAFAEIARVLRNDAGIYLVDFGRLRSERSINYFAHQYADRQPELFTLDYLYSLRAAFSLKDFKNAGKAFRDRATVRSSFLVPFMVATKSSPRGDIDSAVKTEINRIRTKLPLHHEIDLKDLITFFRLGGVQSPYLPAAL